MKLHRRRRCFPVVLLRRSLDQVTLGFTSSESVFETLSDLGCSILSGLVLWLFWNSCHWVAFWTVLERAKALGSWPVQVELWS